MCGVWWLLCIIGSQRCLLFNLPAPGVESSNKLLRSSTKLSKQFPAAGEYVQKLNLENMYKNSICTRREKRCILSGGAAQHGGTSQALRIALPHIKIFHKPCFCTTESFHFPFPGIFSPYGDNMLDNLRDPSSDF